MSSTHHISDVDHWGAPDRNYYVFVVLSFLFGFLGLDHFYLRSFGTGFQKLILNVFGLGIWYIWDIVQITTEADKVRSEGLSSPFDWIRGIGRGVFTEKMTGGAAMPQKSYLLYAFLAICFGWLGADKFYIGETFQGFTKLFSCFNIFLFIFGWLWVAWDAFHAFFMTKSILQDGISPPIPFNYLFDKTKGSIFVASGGASESNSSISWMTSLLPSVPDFSGIAKEVKGLVPLVVTPPVVKAIESINTNLGALKPELPTVPNLNSLKPELPTVPSLNSLKPELPTVPSLSTLNPTAPPMSGGGAPSNPGPVIAGVLTALVLVGGLKGTFDFISKQF